MRLDIDIAVPEEHDEIADRLCDPAVSLVPFLMRSRDCVILLRVQAALIGCGNMHDDHVF